MRRTFDTVACQLINRVRL